MPADFSWIDGERLLRFGSGTLAEAGELLRGRGFDGYVLATTERGLSRASELADAASKTAFVSAGPVAEAAASLRDDVDSRPVVALGGGRVIDSAKAVAAAGGQRCAAIPTTLSGAELTRIHRLPAGVENAGLVRPCLVVTDCDLAASQPMPDLAASAMNALAHAIEALYVPQANPVSELAALQAAELTAGAFSGTEPVRSDLALAAFLSAWALDASDYAVHHMICQSLVAICDTPHSYTNAVMLPHTVSFMAPRAPRQIARLARALSAQSDDPTQASARVGWLCSRASVTRLSELGVDASAVSDVVDAALERPQLRNTPPKPPTRAELLDLLGSAL